jgi:hypothetical protein
MGMAVQVHPGLSGIGHGGRWSGGSGSPHSLGECSLSRWAELLVDWLRPSWSGLAWAGWREP